MMRGVRDLSNLPRTVKPRKPVDIYMPIVVRDSEGNAYYEQDDKMRPWDFTELLQYLYENWPARPNRDRDTVPIMLASFNPHREFLHAYNLFGQDSQWQARINVKDDPEKKKVVKGTDHLIPRYFGFRLPSKHTQYFHPISPLSFMRDFNSYGEPDWPEWLRLYRWAGMVRKWIRAHKLRFSPTRGGLSAQLLRDEKFYPNARRQVPRLTNEKARRAMPGNFYAITKHKDLRKTFGSVYVIDQENAHHYAARTIQLPDANTLLAYGRYIEQSDKPYARPNGYQYDQLMREHGLLRLRVYVPPGLLGALPPWAANPGLRNIYAYTNELPLLRKLGVDIRHIAYAWTSPDTDSGLALYAQWSETQTVLHPDEKPWLKPLLLSAYGILGTRPRHMESGYSHSKSGEDHTYLMHTTPLPMRRRRSDQPIQSPVTNTVHRGMIEAETRRLSVEMARQLEAEGHTILAIHADAVIVLDEGQQLPLMPPPWRVKHKLNRFTMLDTVSFESEALTILPGRKRNV